jgi:7-cyano-7-deazaguanine synthase in queuosine biosynthesis
MWAVNYDKYSVHTMSNYEQLKTVYETSVFKNILHLIDGVYVPLSQKWKNIGVSVSGGADSALMSYLLCNLITKNQLDITVHIITNIRCWKTRPWQRHNSIEVYGWLTDKFKNIQFKRHENFIAPELEWGSKGPSIVDEYGRLKSGNQIELRAHAEYVAHTEKLDAWYCGVTKNPDKEFDQRLTDRDVFIDTVSDALLDKLIKAHMGGFACHPFTYVQKDWIVAQFKRLGIMDLFDLTRSCEGDLNTYPEIFGDLDYRTYVPGLPVPVCGKCFWCQERQWGVDKCQD